MNDREKSRSSGKQHIYEGTFDYTLPRPPALGEERAYNASERGAQPLQMDRRHYKSSSPVPKFDFDDGSSYRPTSRPSSRHGKPPAYLAWAESLHNLLQDSDGVKLFLRYLESEGPHHADTLRFWFACEGLKNHDQVENIQKLVKLIYKTYFLKSALQINDDLKKQIMRNLKSPQCLEPPITLFDEAQAQIENLINKTTYPNFLKSDIYLQYVQSVENASSDDFNSESSSSSSSLSNKDLGNLASGLGPLPTLHEGMEFSLNTQQPVILTPASVSTGYHTPTVRLTKDMLLRSQKHRALDIRPKSETYAGLIYRSSGAHVAYNSYNPVSRQDSEMQSLSSHSDARTESDNMSLNESNVDGRPGRSLRKSIEEKQMRQFARNKEVNMNQRFIPRTQRMDVGNNCLPIEEHAALLIKKLENLKREQENQELFKRRLKEGDSLSSLDDKFQTRDIESAMREKLQFQDDNDQDILDEHVSRVFSDHSLSISPGLVSPKASSPPRGRWSQSQARRRDKDVFSIFSSDSGNVHDFAESSERLPKSKSVPEYNDDRFSRAASCRRSAKKTLTDLTDSGVSVVSDTASVVPVPKDSRVLTWLMESDRSAKTAPSHAHSEMAVGRKYAKRYGSRSNSLERPGPAQPFIADPSMPPLPSPNTDIQLEEIRRRLTEDDGGRRSKQRSSKYYPEVAQSGQSTLRKSTRGQKPTPEDMTIVVFSFCDEQFPYRTKIPGSQITLRQFKEYLPKKGNYRFFFKTVCEDQVTHEEVSNDSEVLPLWEGKIMAQVKPID
ncbi:axis inhibition protein isoform X1 [Tribolium castaneum]|uniref:axis inhibition protein isoform X1 n=1 Tax=Tribolium castaneum TaxID=7070 RepID=UPI00046C0615|nr:PREDICTED: axis inhibition protein isoform X2 [Tribolium castaneum]|eukprot:XP_008196701.1 PREDICTED: axis inhibition protein isoform X2 [Tribolium castaneum]